MSHNSLENRMKAYETHTSMRLLPYIPVMCRLDGRSFHTFTKDLNRPFDERMIRLMIGTTRYLVEETQALCGYTQSDEITLVWMASTPESDIFFGGRVLKMTSITAAMASALFNRVMLELLPEKKDFVPLFDSRVWNLPTESEAANCFLWREMDATRNSVSMAARCYYSHKELMNKSTPRQHEMLFQKGVNWNDYPVHFKRGTYVRRKWYETTYTPEQIAELPESHEAKRDPNFKIIRSKVEVDELPPLKSIENREDVIFRGVNPVLKVAETPRKTTKGRAPTATEFEFAKPCVKFDSEAWSRDNPGYPDPLCDPEDWTPPPKRWLGIREYLYVEEKNEQD